MFDLNSRASRLEKEQQKRREQLLKQKQLEQKKRLEHAQREQELAERARIKKEEEELERLKQESLAQEEYQLTNGIIFEKRLFQYYSLEDERDDDKVLLPEEYLSELHQLDVFGRGAIIFRLISIVNNGVTPNAPTTTIITHAGIREFTAPPNQIGLPRKIIDTLGGDITKIQEIFLKYVVLPKCRYIKVQPKLNRFFEVQPIKRCFEDNLHKHTCLSIGDLLTIQYRGESYPIVVKEIQPDKYVSLLDTDVEVELENSEEFLQQQPQVLTQPVTVAEPPVSVNVFNSSVGRVLGSNPTPSSSSSGSSSSSTPMEISNNNDGSGDGLSQEVERYLMTILSSSSSSSSSVAATSNNNTAAVPMTTIKFKLPVISNNNSNSSNKTSFVASFPTNSTKLKEVFVRLCEVLGLQTVSQVARLQVSIRLPQTITWSIQQIDQLDCTLQEHGFPTGSVMVLVTC